MTYNEARTEIIQRLTRVGSNRISGEDAREAVLTVLDFAAAIDTSQGSGIPDWNAELTFQTDGTDAGRWCTHPDANGKKRIFETKVDDNTGNEPPTDPEVTENSFWEEISPSAGSGITEWTPGLYQSGLVIVYHNHSTDGSGFYRLVEAERPFNSSNIETEITEGSWERIGGSGGGAGGIAATYADIDTMLADQANQELNLFYLVLDASDDPTVDAGWAVYQKLAGLTGDLSDYRKLGEQESMDVIFDIPQATDTVAGKAKLYSDLNNLNADGPVTQGAAVKGIQKPTPACATVAGTNAYTAVLTPSITAYEVNQIFFLKFPNGNTVDGPTVAIDGLPALTLKVGTTNVPSGFIRAGQIYACMYDGADLQVVSFLGLNISSAELAAIPAGATNLFTVTKSIDGLMVTYGAGVEQIDNFAGGSLSSLLADSANWVGDQITLTGDNRNGELGETAQEYVISGGTGTMYKCIAHSNGTDATDGSATWIRTRSRDNLNAVGDSAIISELENETGWDPEHNTKVITTRSIVGSWHTSIEGYTYFCFDQIGGNYYWRRIGQPEAVFVQITDAALIAEIEAHDFVTTPMLVPVAAVKGEDRQEHFWQNPAGTPHLAKCIDIAGVKNWIKIK